MCVVVLLGPQIDDGVHRFKTFDLLVQSNRTKIALVRGKFSGATGLAAGWLELDRELEAKPLSLGLELVRVYLGLIQSSAVAAPLLVVCNHAGVQPKPTQ